MSRLAQLIGIISCSMIVISCGNVRIVFEMDQADTYLKPGTIAVISGTNKDEDHMLAESVSENLRNETEFQVISQKEIAEKIPDYYYKSIISGWENIPEGMERRFWFSPENMKAIKAVHKYLNTEYIYVVWSGDMRVIPSQPMCVVGACILAAVTLGAFKPSGNVGETSFSIIYVYGRLISFPDGDVIGYTADNFYNESCCITMSFKTYNYEISVLIEDAGHEIAREMKKFTKNKEVRKKK